MPNVVRKNTTIMEFYNSPIVSGSDVIHAEFMDRKRMAQLIDQYDNKASRAIEKHLEIHDIESTKQRLKTLKAEIDGME